MKTQKSLVIILWLAIIMAYQIFCGSLAMAAEHPRDVVVEAPNYTAVFSTHGGSLKSLKLKNYNQDCYECAEDLWPKVKKFFTGNKNIITPETPGFVELVNVRDGMPYPLAVTFSDSTYNIAADVVYEASAPKLILNTKDKQQLIFIHTSNNIKVEKIFTFDPAGYTIDFDVKIHNLAAAPITQAPVINWYQYANPQKANKDYGHEGAIVSLGPGKVERTNTKTLSGETYLGPNVSWSAYESKYFIAALIPRNPSLSNVVITRDSNNMITVGTKGNKELIPGGQDVSLSYSLYMGPKKHDLLLSLGVGMEYAIDFGLFRLLSVPLLLLLNFLHGFVINYGIAIIIMTVLIKAAFLPLGSLSSKSMKAMRDIKPKIDKLKEKYKGDKIKISQETMALYRQYKVNPFSGILPILIQVPVFIGLYRVLMYSVELRHSPFFFWIQDLSARDPFYIVPVLMGISQFVVQKITPSVGNEEMKKVMLWMPVLFTFLFMSFPAGLVIYWMLNNILQIAQQLYLNKKLGLNDVVHQKQKIGQLATDVQK